MRILSVDGGGYLGIASAAFLHALEQRYGVTCAEQFDLFCGTSTGAIIALALASGKTAGEVVKMYEAMGPEVFKAPSWLERRIPSLRLLRALWRPLHRNDGLQRALETTFGEMTLAELEKAKKRVLIPTFSLTKGRPVVFKTDHSPHLRAHSRYRLRDIALASSAAPMYLPLVEIVDPLSDVSEVFCDGGLVANSPGLLGYVEAVHFLREDPTNVSLLSVGTPREDLGEAPSDLSPSQSRLDRGLLGWGLGERILTVAVDAGGMATDTAVRFLSETAGARYTRVTLSQPAGLGLDIATPAATKTLKQLGVARAMDGELLKKLEHLFRNPEV